MKKKVKIRKVRSPVIINPSMPNTGVTAVGAAIAFEHVENQITEEIKKRITLKIKQQLDKVKHSKLVQDTNAYRSDD